MPKINPDHVRRPGESDADCRRRQPPRRGNTFEAKGDKAYAEVVAEEVRTLDDLLAYMQVDLKVWEVEKHTINKWEVGAKPGENNSLKVNRPKTGFSVQPLFQIKAWLVKRKPTVRDVAFENLLEGFRRHGLPRLRLPPRRPRRDQVTVEASLYDAHFGLLSWGKETGERFDLNIATTRYLAALQDLAEKFAIYRPSRILLPVGNDFFHINNPEGYTPASHHHLDVDGRLCKVFEAGTETVIQGVKLLAELAPVEVIWIPGNHDPETSFYLCSVIAAYFHRTPGITVDTAPAPRKYRHFGCNLIGYTHGNEERHADLPTIMANEMKEAWTRSTTYEWHTGHFHKEKETRFMAADTYGAVVVRTLPSIAGTDAWHFKKGYVQGHRIAEGFVFSHTAGLICQLCTRDLRTPAR